MLTAVVLVGTAACGGTSEATADGAVTVEATDSTCDVGTTDLPAGTTTFAITNGGGSVTEVYVYAGERVVTEKENIGPGTSYDLTVQLAPGDYEVACKPGMQGDGIRTPITVSDDGSAAGAGTSPAQDQAATEYRVYVQEQADALVPATQRFADAVAAGDVETAKALYAPSREPWERVEPVAEAFGDLDPRVDLREADLAPGEEWTGWHRIEKALFADGTTEGMAPVAEQLVADVQELAARVPDAEITVASIGNGAKELLDEVATGKVTGEEEAFSHTDLWDLAANVEGAEKAFGVLRPLVSEGDPQLVTTLEQEFADLDAVVAQYRTADGFVSYDTVDDAGRRELARDVDALSEPLSRLTAAALS